MTGPRRTRSRLLVYVFHCFGLVRTLMNVSDICSGLNVSDSDTTSTRPENRRL
ncbi:hypothetical protein DAI22_07g154800 [Oryza sativa Japonica Group]|nr:hypothetical protein DAI22_07g154800 [Oryza sativa Japonica Group]